MDKQELREELMRLRMALELTKDINEKDKLMEQVEKTRKEYAKIAFEEIQNKRGRGK